MYQAAPLVGVAQVGLRASVKDFFFTVTGGYFKNWFSSDEIIDLDDLGGTFAPDAWGAGAELAYVTPLGPIKLLGTWSPRTGVFAQDAGLYISLGFDF